MNGLEEIRGCAKSFICEKTQVKKQIAEIEQKRTQLAEQRNEKKKTNSVDSEVYELGKQISELGNQSQELQNKLDSNFGVLKAQINLIIDNSVAEGMRKIRRVYEEIQELKNKIANYTERNERYQLQREEFYLRFGRMPELSESAKKENKLQEKEILRNKAEIKNYELQIELIQGEIAEFTRLRKELQKGNLDCIVNENERIQIEETQVENMEAIEEFYVEEFPPIEELHIEALNVEEFKLDEENQTVKTEENIVENTDDEIEKLAKAIVEEIATQQAELNIKETEEVAEDIITFEEKEETKQKVIIPLFGKKPSISNITIKFEEGELLYKAKMTDDEEIKIYPAMISEENVLLRDKQNRKECEEILINYSVSEHKIFDKKVINKIDPLVCELLIECADKYAFDAQELIYNYAMSFSYGEESDLIPEITYNLSYIESSKLTRKEKAIINKICRDARKNNKVEIIEAFTKFKKIKYVLKRLFAVNNVNLLPEGKK